MINKINEFFVLRIVNFVKNTIHEVRSINNRYKIPHAKMTKGVRFSLIMLRVYLLVLVAILFYKFITLI
jgi:hypothetical protein